MSLRRILAEEGLRVAASGRALKSTVQSIARRRIRGVDYFVEWDGEDADGQPLVLLRTGEYFDEWLALDQVEKDLKAKGYGVESQYGDLLVTPFSR